MTAWTLSRHDGAVRIDGEFTDLLAIAQADPSPRWRLVRKPPVKPTEAVTLATATDDQLCELADRLTGLLPDDDALLAQIENEMERRWTR